MEKKVDKIRVDETARVTDAVLDEIGIDGFPLPPQFLEDMIWDVAEELGIELTAHEVHYIAYTNIKWVYSDINREKAEKGAELRKKDTIT